MMEAAKTNPYLAKLMPKMQALLSPKIRQNVCKAGTTCELFQADSGKCTRTGSKL